MYSAIRSAAPARALARAFSTSGVKQDLSKVTLIGRLGADPVLKTTASDKPYYTYNVATSSAPIKTPDGKYQDGHTSWHHIFSFSEAQHNTLSKLGKGSVVYVEAELEMRRTENDAFDRPFLRQNVIRSITRVQPESASEGASAEGEDA